MSLLDHIFKKLNLSSTKKTCEIKTSGELISEITDGTNLVDGKKTWEYAETHKSDIELMKRCCESELKTMTSAGIVPAPFYFERVAILSRKLKDYRQEIEYCERYIQAIEDFYRSPEHANHADIRNSPRYKAIFDRLPKAKELLANNP